MSQSETSERGQSDRVIAPQLSLDYSIHQQEAIRNTKIRAALMKTAYLADRIKIGRLEIQARQYQHDVWTKLQATRDSGHDSALIHLATGLGKTTIAVADALQFADGFVEKNGREPKILFAVHQTEILDQAAARFHSAEPNLTQGRFDSSSKDLSSTITFATMQSLHKNIDNLDPELFDYIIYDEVHHSRADTFNEVVEHFKPSFKLGLTATPNRMDEKDIRSLFGEELYSKTLAEAMTEGFLADVDYHIVFDEAVKKAMDNKFEFSSLKEIRELLSNESRNIEIAIQIREKMEEIGLKDAKTIIFCQSVEQADEMASLLDGSAYHSNISVDERKKILESFKSNGLQVIATRDMFNEGVDIPDARLVIFLRSTSSRTIFEQQLGRGLRKHGDKDTVSVLDFVANIERLTLVNELAESIKDVNRHNGTDTIEEIGTASEKGIKVSGDHTEFEFDKISVDLISKIADIRENNKFENITIQDLANAWIDCFGDEKPTRVKIGQAAQDGLFISLKTLDKNFGGIKPLHEALGFEVNKYPDDINGLADLWRERFGDAEPTTDKIVQYSKDYRFVSLAVVARHGGVVKLKDALGFEVKKYPDDINGLADLWRERFGDAEFTYKNIQSASRNKEFVSIKTVNKFGGISAFRQILSS